MLFDGFGVGKGGKSSVSCRVAVIAQSRESQRGLGGKGSSHPMAGKPPAVPGGSSPAWDTARDPGILPGSFGDTKSVWVGWS